MPRQQPRYMVKNAAGLYYTGNEVVETVPVPRKSDPTQNDMVQRFAAVFDNTNDAQALKFDTEADARAAMAHPDCVDLAVFSGCVVEDY